MGDARHCNPPYVGLHPCFQKKKTRIQTDLQKTSSTALSADPIRLRGSHYPLLRADNRCAAIICAKLIAQVKVNGQGGAEVLHPCADFANIGLRDVDDIAAA